MSQTEQEVHDQVRETFRQLKAVKDQIAYLETVKEQLTAALADAGEEDLQYVDATGVEWTGVVVTQTRPIVNLPMLRKLHPWLAARITREVVDTDKLNESLDQGQWTAELRDAVVTMKSSRPGVRITKKNTTTTKEEVNA